MLVYLLRHGHSLSPKESGVASDAERPLSELGRDEIKKSLSELLRRGGRPELILHSPLRRAQETADIARQILPEPHSVRLYVPLGNILPAQDLAPLLEKDCSKASQVLAIGHQPQLGDLAALLSGREFEVRTGWLAALEINGADAKALWNYNPE